MSAGQAHGAAPASARRGAAAGTRPLPGPADSAAGYDNVVMVLQGGGALGAYQCGVYEALDEAGIRPRWFAGTSIGAINAAILAGNPPERRVARLREFWETVSVPGSPLGAPLALATEWLDAGAGGEAALAWLNGLGAASAIVHGQRGFFAPRLPLSGSDPVAAATSFYDTSPLVETLERLVDFDLIASGAARLSVGATQVRSGNSHTFDSAHQRLGPEHILASGALPPAFPAVVIEGEPYWDGGIVSNTPLEHVLESETRRDTLVFQVDLWSARGPTPRTLQDVLEREKDIRFSSRTRKGTDLVAQHQHLRNTLGRLLHQLPAGVVAPELMAELEPWLCHHVFNIIHLIYQPRAWEAQYKDYAFDAATMRRHWASGLEDMRRTLAHPEFFVPPSRAEGVVTHDIHRHLAGQATHA